MLSERLKLAFDISFVDLSLLLVTNKLLLQLLKENI